MFPWYISVYRSPVHYIYVKAWALWQRYCDSPQCQWHLNSPLSLICPTVPFKHIQKMTESLSCHQKKYFNDFPSGMSCRLWKELSKGQGQMAQFVNKAVNQSMGSQENCCKQFFLFLLSCGSSVILKDPQDSGQAHVPPMNPRNPVFSCLPFFLSQI